MKMPNYSKGKIYIIESLLDEEEMYVGSTTTSLKTRIMNHQRTNTRNKLHEYFDTIGWNYAQISLIEDYPCSSKKDLLKKERDWYNEINPTLNERRPYRFRDEFLEYHKKYDNMRYQTRHRKEYHKMRVGEKIHCGCGGQTDKSNLSKHNKTEIHQMYLKEQDKQVCIK